MARRTVYFYETYILTDLTGVERRVDSGFWTSFKKRIGRAPELRRTATLARVAYVGERRTCASPAASYLYLGRLRTKAEWPDGYELGVGFTDLDLEDATALGEPVYLLDFEGGTSIATLGRSTGAPRVSAIEEWLTNVSGLKGRGLSVVLRPILSDTFLRDLDAAVGAKKTTFKVDKKTQVPHDGGGPLADAIRLAKEVSSEMTVTLTLSVERGKATIDSMADLAQGVKWVVQNEVAKGGAVSLVLENADGERRVEHYDFFKQRITESVEIADVDDVDSRATEESVISAMQGAIERLQTRERTQE